MAVAFLAAAACAATLGAQDRSGGPFTTPWGEPDLQGIWANRSVTPFERPRAFGDRATLSAEERAAIEKASVANTDRDRRQGARETDVARAYNDFWNERGAPPKASDRTSLLIDPPNGRLPDYTPQALKKYADWAARTGRVGSAASLVGRRLVAGGTSEDGVVDGLEGGGDGRGVRSDNPEDRNLGERCLSFGVPRLPGGYNNNLQIVQSPGIVSILTEMGYETRIIPTDGRPHLPAGVRQWLGDSRGRWEGSTLVVDTTNFSGKQNFRGSFETLHLVERFTRVDARTIDYQITVDDPATWVRPWTASIPITALEDQVPQIFPYDCHEGNYGMTNLLRGARMLERGPSVKPASR
ncbi:MAG: hypothetical protein AB7O32_06990 [Vicinamibacterales bacterium]